MKTKTPEIEYGFHCESCRVRKKFGAARISAGQAATRHWQRFYDHVVILTETRVLSRMTRDGAADHELGDEPPF